MNEPIVSSQPRAQETICPRCDSILKNGVLVCHKCGNPAPVIVPVTQTLQEPHQQLKGPTT